MKTTTHTNMKTSTTILGLILATGVAAFAQQPAETADPAKNGSGTIVPSGINTTDAPSTIKISRTGGGNIEYTVIPEEAGKLGEPITLHFSTLSGQALYQDKPVGYLGVSHSPVPREMSGQLPIPPNTGLLIDVVAENSPAAKAGLQVGDVLAKLDDQILITPDQFAVLVAGHKEGDSVKLGYLRKGQLTETTAVLGKRESKETDAPAGEFSSLSVNGIPATGEPGKPIRTFVGRVGRGSVSSGNTGSGVGRVGRGSASYGNTGSGGISGTVVIGGSQAVAGQGSNGAPAPTPPPIDDNAELRTELQQLRATLDALQERLK